jgi:hypothetical protein
MTSAARDPVMRALGGLATGAAAGAAVVTGGLLVLRTVQRSETSGAPESSFLILSAAAVLGLMVAAASGWLLSRGIADLWRRGVTAMLAVFGSVLLALAAVPADGVGGRGGLAAYLLLLLAAARYAGMQARRAL